MPWQNSKTAVASSKRWPQKENLSEAASSFDSKSAQTSRTSSTSIATQTAKTEKNFSVPHDICTPEELLSFAEESPTLLANLPSHIGVDLKETTLSETITGQLSNILAKYEHKLQEAGVSFSFTWEDFSDSNYTKHSSGVIISQRTTNRSTWPPLRAKSKLSVQQRH